MASKPTALHLFSAAVEKVAFGATHYRLRSDTISSVLGQLFEGYQTEGLPMPISLEEFEQNWIKKRADHLLSLIPLEKRVEGLSTEELKRLLHEREAAEAASANPKKGGTP